MAATTTRLDLATPSVNSQTVEIKEDSKFLKTIASIPLLGVIISNTQKVSLLARIEELFNKKDPEDLPRLIRLGEVLNEYRVIEVGRDLITGAVGITGFALGVMNSFVLSAALGFVGVAAFYVYEIKELNKTLVEWKSSQARRNVG